MTMANPAKDKQIISTPICCQLANVIVEKASRPIFDLPEMKFGDMPLDGGNLLMTRSELTHMELTPDQQKKFIRQIFGSTEFINGKIALLSVDRGRGFGRGNDD